MRNVSVEPRVESIRFGGPGGEVVNVPYAVATVADEDRTSDQLLTVVPGLLTSPDMTEDIASQFANMTGMDTIVIRTEYGKPNNPFREVPDRGGMLIERITDRQLDSRSGYEDKINLIAQSAGGIAVPKLIVRGGVDSYVAISTVGLTIRGQLDITPERQAELDAEYFSERASSIYKHLDVEGRNGEQRAVELLKGFLKNCGRETLYMARNLEGRAMRQSMEGGYLDVVRNMLPSEVQRPYLGLGIGTLGHHFRQPRIGEALRLAASADSWPEFERAQTDHGTKIGGVFGRRDPIIPIEAARAAQDRFDAFTVLDTGHPFMVSSAASVVNAGAVNTMTDMNKMSDAA